MKIIPFLTVLLFTLSLIISCDSGAASDTIPPPLDVYFLFDVTGSMGGEIATFQNSFPDIVAAVFAEYPDSRFGLGTFQDYPVDTYGEASDHAFSHLVYLGYDLAVMQAAANGLSAGGGNDGPESQIPALAATATGTGDGTGSYCIADDPNPGPPDYIGYPHFRKDAIRLVVLITDAPFHNGPGDVNTYSGIPGVSPPSFDQAVADLVSAGIKVIGINSDSAEEHLTALALATDSVDGDGNALVYDIGANGIGLKSAVIEGILNCGE